MEPAHARQAVVIRLGPRALAIPIEHVVETLRPLPIVPRREDRESLTSSQRPATIDDGVLGLAEIRGAACRVIDLARRLAITDDTPARRFVVVRGARGPVALQVGDVLDIRALGDGPPLAGDAPRAALVGDGLAPVLCDARWIEPSGLHGAAGAVEPHDVP